MNETDRYNMIWEFTFALTLAVLIAMSPNGDIFKIIAALWIWTEIEMSKYMDFWLGDWWKYSEKE